tara:strand:- start:12371 stop:13069 length:699 start_codon:yes stop_codon:yes gene_type:complete
MTNRALKKSGVFDTKSELKVIENDQRKIIFIPMHHIGKKEFYDDVAKKVDSLQNLNFTVFYEGAINDKETDSLIQRKNGMKLRKLFGYYLQRDMDTTSNIIGEKTKYTGKHKLINQPKYSELNVDSVKAIKADVSLSELMNEFEKNYGEITLDSCDYNYDIIDKNYDCKKADKSLLKIFKKEYIKDYRNKSLAEKIFESNKDKILVIYGSSHYFGLYFELLKLDKNYRIEIK